MSEYVPTSRPRIVRILCLHGRGQSAASFRALLAPLIPRLPKNYEFHFLDAPFVVLDEDVGSSRSGQELEMLRAIEGCSRLEAAQGRDRAMRAKLEMETPRSRRGDKVQPQVPSSSPDIEALRSSISSSYRIGAEVLEAFDRAGIDECEMLLGRQGYIAPDRDWVLASSSEGGDDVGSGLDTSLGRLSDYLRMQGPFHGAMAGGSGSSWLIVRLLSSLLDPSHHPQSALAYPTMFPLLPLDAPAPRMGGWEVLPSVPLPSGRRTAVSQGPLGFMISVGSSGGGSQEKALASEAHQWATKASQEQELLSVLPAKTQRSRPPMECDRAVAATEQDAALLA